MKAKTIKAVIRNKVNAWLESIEDETVRKLLAKNVIVTGGCIASMLLKEKVNDFDLYFRTQEAAEMAAGYYVAQFKKNPPPRFADMREIPIHVLVEGDRVKIVVKSAGIASATGDQDYRYFEGDQDPGAPNAEDYVQRAMGIVEDAEDEGKPQYRPVFLSANAITLSQRVQLIVRFHGEPDEVHKNYDFAHCTNYWTSWNNELYLRPEALEALLTRELRYNGSRYPLCSIIRLRKFIKRGWTINAGQILKMVMQLNALDLTDLSVLEDQLTGVDVAYFIEVINALRERDEKTVDSAYLLEIIDRMF